jgi:hypothetical protein
MSCSTGIARLDERTFWGRGPLGLLLGPDVKSEIQPPSPPTLLADRKARTMIWAVAEFLIELGIST